MAAERLEEIMHRSEELTLDERLRLATYLLERARLECSAVRPAGRRKWREVRGLVEEPLVGEDAQAWVTRTRHESDESREKQCQHRQ
jgi:hypothetical protein